MQSVGDSSYKAMQIQFGRRLNAGLQFDFTYTFGKGTDTAPLISTLSVTGDDPRSDPANLQRDKGPNLMDVRHNFAGTIIFSPSVHAGNQILNAIANHNQVAALLQFNSGLPLNEPANQDLNGDGVNSDRPLDVTRNPLYLPVRKNVDLRYTRWIPIRGSSRAEVIAELKNVFNTEQMSAINTTTVVDAAGNPAGTIPSDPYDFVNPSGFEQRKFQLGFKIRF